MEKTDLEKLMKQIYIDRDEMAFSKIFDFMAPKINGYFLQNGIESNLAEELTQDVMSTVWSKSNLYNSKKSSLSTWVFTIARNKKVDFLRKNSKFKSSEDDIRDFMYSPDYNDQIEKSEIEEKISKINAELDKDQRKMIKMNFFENKSHKKIADELEIPLGTVKSRIRHILIKMQRFI